VQLQQLQLGIVFGLWLWNSLSCVLPLEEVRSLGYLLVLLSRNLYLPKAKGKWILNWRNKEDNLSLSL
jgi:hypothetical protein